MFNYPVTLTPDGDTVLVTFADVPEAITFGASVEDALAQAVDTETVAAAALAAGLRGPAIGQAVARARSQALDLAQLQSASEAQ